MRTRTLLTAGIVLVGGLVVVLLMRTGAPVESAAGAAPGASASSAPSADAAVALPAQPNEASQRAQPLAAESEAEPASVAAASAVLIVLVVSSEDGTPLEDIRVQVGPHHARSWSAKSGVKSKGTLGDALQTDAEGRVEFTLDPGAYQVWAHRDVEPRAQARDDVAELAAGERRELRLELNTRLDVSFHGRVVSSADETSLAGARIEVRNGIFYSGRDNPDWTRSDVGQTLTCDADGRFELKAPSWMLWQARADASGFGPMLFPILSGHETPEKAYVVHLARGAALEVLLRPANAGSELKAFVRVSGFEMVDRDRDPDYFSSGDEIWTAPFDAAGRASFADLPSGVGLELSLRSGSKLVREQGETLRLEAGETRQVEIVLGGGAMIRGLLVDAQGAPVSGAEIWLASDRFGPGAYLHPYFDPTARAQTDSAGAFRFEDVAAATWLVGPAPAKRSRPAQDDEALAPHAQAVTIQPGDTVVDVRLIAHRGLYIRGRVVDASDAPVPNALVLAQAVEESAFLNEMSHPDGAFSIGPLAAGSFSLTAGGTGSNFARSRPVVVHAGDADVVLRVAAGASVSGIVVLADGQPARARVSLTALDGGDWAVAMSSTQADGTFSFNGLEPGRYVVAASTGEAEVGREECDARAGGDPASVRVTVQPGARVRVRYLGPEDYGNFQIRSGRAVVAADGLARGDSQVASVPAGEVSLSLYARREDFGTGPEVRTLQIAVGELQEVVFGKAP